MNSAADQNRLYAERKIHIVVALWETRALKLVHKQALSMLLSAALVLTALPVTALALNLESVP